MMSSVTPTTDGRVLRGEQTRRAILERAGAIASVEGLDGLSIGRLATELSVSKSGVFAHFGSKEELQLATIEAARETFVESVIRPARRAPPGVRRLRALCERWLDYSRERVFPGGCFFYAVAAEFDARPGRVRDAIAAMQRDWRRVLAGAVEDAQAAGELADGVDGDQLVFELDAYARAANADALLHDDRAAFDRARRAILDRLRAAAVDPAAIGAA